MLKTRVIPVLLLRNAGLVKTVKFKDPKYVGDPINAVKIFNEKEVDELIFLDITATLEKREPSYEVIRDIASECFMPFGYGGGVRSIDACKKLFEVGAEKVIFNSAAHDQPQVIRQCAEQFGVQSTVVSIDVRKSLLGKYEVCSHAGTKNTHKHPVAFAQDMERLGAGEIVINAIDRDGTQSGYDTSLLQQVSEAVTVPVVALGGAGSLEDFRKATQIGGASAVAAGSFFVFHGKHRAVLITYPSQKELASVLG